MAYPTVGCLTDYAETQMGTWAFTDGTVTRPTAWYIGLFTAAPGEDAAGTEVTATGYAREQVALEETEDAGVFENDAEVAFGPLGEDAGEVTHWGIFDAETSGHLWAYCELPTPQSLWNGDTATFAAGALEVQLY